MVLRFCSVNKKTPRNAFHYDTLRLTWRKAFRRLTKQALSKPRKEQVNPRQSVEERVFDLKKGEAVSTSRNAAQPRGKLRQKVPQGVEMEALQCPKSMRNAFHSLENSVLERKIANEGARKEEESTFRSTQKGAPKIAT